MTSILRLRARNGLRTGVLVGLGLMTTACTEDGGEELEHGVVQVQFRRAEGEAGNPYTGTVQLEITLTYLECLTNFYANNPDYTQEGIVGLPAFGTLDQGGEGWTDRLCDDDDGEAAPCNVVSIKQELVSAQYLTVVYEITGELEDRYVNFGPLPTPELAMCEGFSQPIVRVAANGQIRGVAGNGDVVWVTKSFDPDQAFTGQGQRIQIRGGLPDN
jgi:hypothetical protein